MSVATALQAFSAAFGPVPGVAAPPAPRHPIGSGTPAVRWVLQHRRELTPGQLAAVRHVVPAYTAAAVAATGGVPDTQLVAVTSYQAIIQAARQAITVKTGHQLRIPIGVDVDDKNERHLPDNVTAYADAVDTSGDQTGPAAKCQIYVRPRLLTATDADVKETLYHEVWHCFEAEMAPSLDVYEAGPSWIVEGEAEWVSESLAPANGSNGWWNRYLTSPGTPLFQRTYDAIGFYSHLTESGYNVWTRLEQILLAGLVSGSEAAFSTALKGGDASRFLDSWASGYARRPVLGREWDTTGPAITGAAATWGTGTVGADGQLHWLDAAPYAGSLRAYDLQAEVVYLGANSDHTRLHRLGGGEELTGGQLRGQYYCAAASSCQCPSGTELAGQTLTRFGAGPALLAVTGGEAGNSVTLTGMRLEDYCKTKNKLDPCVIGSWRSQRIEGWTIGGVTWNGADGVQLRIAKSGDSDIDFSGMQPLEGDFGHGNRAFGAVQGSAHTVITTAGGVMTSNGPSGTFSIVAHVHTEDGLDLPPVTVPLDGWPPAGSESYTCAQNTLTFVRTPPAPTLVYLRQ